MPRSVDLPYESCSTLVLLRPITSRAANWLHASVGPEAFWWTGALVVEPRYVADIVTGACEAGLEVR